MIDTVIKNWKRYLISSGVTFLAAFLLTIAPMVSNLDVDNIEKSAIIALLAVGLRAGVKAVIEYLTTLFSTKKLN